jgi:hypothetical protein
LQVRNTFLPFNLETTRYWTYCWSYCLGDSGNKFRPITLIYFGGTEHTFFFRFESLILCSDHIFKILDCACKFHWVASVWGILNLLFNINFGFDWLIFRALFYDYSLQVGSTGCSIVNRKSSCGHATHFFTFGKPKKILCVFFLSFFGRKFQKKSYFFFFFCSFRNSQVFLLFSNLWELWIKSKVYLKISTIRLYCGYSLDPNKKSHNNSKINW